MYLRYFYSFLRFFLYSRVLLVIVVHKKILVLAPYCPSYWPCTPFAGFEHLDFAAVVAVFIVALVARLVLVWPCRAAFAHTRERTASALSDQIYAFLYKSKIGFWGHIGAKMIL